MKFKVPTDSIKTRELVESEDSLKLALKLMSRFMVDETGNPIPQEEAYDQLLDLTLEEQAKASEAFTNAIIPNLKGRRS
jgi:hypothetical protein